MNDTTVQNLMRLSKPRQFEKGAYIFHEGDPGEELFIILKGSVGVYITDFLEESIQVSTMKAGELFGEMALVDQQPRSASCVALEDSVFVTIDRGHLTELISTCPEIAENLLWALSARLRRAEEALYKTDPAEADAENQQNFSIPPQHRQHNLRKPEPCSPALIRQTSVYCPSCGDYIRISYADPNKLSVREILPSQRPVYDNINPLWYSICTCPSCGYTNTHEQFSSGRSQFSTGHPEHRQAYAAALAEQKRVLSALEWDKASSFDQLTYQYYQAIHINARFNPSGVVLLGKLWLHLGWLYEDVCDGEMRDYCYERAIPYYERAYHIRDRLMKMERTRQKCAMVLAELYRGIGDVEKARAYYEEVSKYTGKQLKQLARDRAEEL